MVGRSFYFVLWHSRFPPGTLSSLFPAVDGAASPVRPQPDRDPAAARFHCIGSLALRGSRYFGGAKRHVVAPSRIDPGGRSRMQQYPFESDAAGHNYGSRAVAIAIFLAKSAGVCRGTPTVRGKEWTPDICARRSDHESRSQFPDWQTPPARWSHLLPYRAVGDIFAPVDSAPR